MDACDNNDTIVRINIGHHVTSDTMIWPFIHESIVEFDIHKENLLAITNSSRDIISCIILKELLHQEAHIDLENINSYIKEPPSRNELFLVTQFGNIEELDEDGDNLVEDEYATKDLEKHAKINKVMKESDMPFPNWLEEDNIIK